MDSQYERSSSSRLGRLRDRVRASLPFDERSSETESLKASDRRSNGSSSTDDDTGNLFHCETCGVVYIATEKEVCSTCDDDLEQVRSTFVHQ
ncbi:hypothetical protein [Natrarchaeobius chitinivorans]|uniref:Uncharacterized protein n=1 Tax=Natrarchaeobius chitinivorans TaxID=1679083 RepID=A0A3N6MIL4_NATCH|nr:hypothetical protein [Natrarchaeobius chitinivorans]RQG93896.1 hypothetical protein EA473_14185 [Natrarchaeobius chitinivorans]